MFEICVLGWSSGVCGFGFQVSRFWFGSLSLRFSNLRFMVQGLGFRLHLSVDLLRSDKHAAQHPRGPFYDPPTHARPFVGVFQRSILDRFVISWRLFPSKWLQNRPKIPKPSPGIPPRRAFRGYVPSNAGTDIGTPPREHAPLCMPPTLEATQWQIVS